MFLGVNTMSEKQKRRGNFFFLKCFICQTLEEKWLNVVFCIEDIAKTCWRAHGQGLQLPTVLVFKMNLDPVDFSFPLNGVCLILKLYFLNLSR